MGVVREVESSQVCSYRFSCPCGQIHTRTATTQTPRQAPPPPPKIYLLYLATGIAFHYLFTGICYSVRLQGSSADVGSPSKLVVDSFANGLRFSNRKQDAKISNTVSNSTATAATDSDKAQLNETRY